MKHLEMKMREADEIKAELERARDRLHELGAEVAESHVDDAIAFLEEFTEFMPEHGETPLGSGKT